MYTIQKDGSYKYNNVKFVDIPTETYPTMVLIEKAPSKLRTLIGKRYITIEKAVKAVDILNAENLITRGTKKDTENLREALAFKELFCG